MDELKQEVLAAFHILDSQGQNAGIAGHLTARVPGGDSFWCHGYGQGFEEVRAADLHQADMALRVLSGPGRINPSLVIHTGLYAARPDIGCVIHTHSPSAVMLTATGSDLLPLFQSALMFAGDCATHTEYEGIIDTEETGRQLAAALGPRRALLLANHGTLVVGRNVREAVHCAIMLDEACRIQLGAMAAACGRPLRRVEGATAAEAKRFLLSDKVLALRWNHYLHRVLAARPWLAEELAKL
ncbi:class II aldolase/adducin family protein [Falsiroseomonas tokyonensis]|uniref:Class II aldolase/adducin family protein n=1 Tax=Falsiroseomonas tokyonensis TaxID=430521 RepID=A0ABV7BXI8_9PROT|nr:class II aldolase/adducin family protein [Falsiroseomonas tokyonensis]MBU8539361.1 class II aldolase/adducin family protein [Falsiroseomonas tokyonensis]